MLKTVLNLQSLDLAGVELLQPFLCDRCQLLSFAGLMIQVFMGSSQHQLDPVQLVYLAGSGIIVHGNDVGFRMLAAQLLDDALSNDMVGRQPKGWTQTMFLVPPLMSSNISPVRNQPSPVWFPRETKPLAMDARYLIFVGGVKWTLFSRAIRADLRKYSRREIAVLQSQAVECFAPR